MIPEQYTHFPTIKEALNWIELTDCKLYVEYNITFIPPEKANASFWIVKRKILKPLNQKEWLKV